MVTRARGIRASLPDLDAAAIPMAAPVTGEKVVYLRDPARSRNAVELPYIPPFLRKHDGMVMSIGQFLQFAGGRIMAAGVAQIWPGMPVEEALVEDGRVCGVRLKDQWDHARHGRARRFHGSGGWPCRSRWAAVGGEARRANGRSG